VPLFRIPRKRHPKPPIATAMLLQLEYGRIFDRAEAWVQKNIVGEWHRDKWAHGPRNRNHRLDASPWVEAKLRLLIAEFEDEISPQKLGPTLDLVAERVNKKADADLRGLLGVKLNQHPGTGFGAQNKFRAENLAKIRSLASAQVSELEEILERRFHGRLASRRPGRRDQGSFRGLEVEGGFFGPRSDVEAERTDHAREAIAGRDLSISVEHVRR
jgi:hypothetical protein